MYFDAIKSLASDSIRKLFLLHLYLLGVLPLNERCVDGTIDALSLAAAYPRIASSIQSFKARLACDLANWNTYGNAPSGAAASAHLKRLCDIFDGRLFWRTFEVIVVQNGIKSDNDFDKRGFKVTLSNNKLFENLQKGETKGELSPVQLDLILSHTLPIKIPDSMVLDNDIAKQYLQGKTHLHLHVSDMKLLFFIYFR